MLSCVLVHHSWSARRTMASGNSLPPFLSKGAWRLIFSLLLVEKEGLGCPSSPQLLSGPGFAELLHLVL